eukprot:CAMPEP_0202878794 /NCGR_PEP_ID=MMETSP1391-20130828/32739_1 /ASSEMBLY_ACC=CAM_ASM_000867 /TAXON_ID=1034604 /ORGANISM="Chlamydomonas leiostraca, Strain SAG 11-49" /LENGTH=38 /DNA_ID= /DNA_START= /DNA_END= /DNA_ORIENTATION=
MQKPPAAPEASHAAPPAPHDFAHLPPEVLAKHVWPHLG